MQTPETPKTPKKHYPRPARSFHQIEQNPQFEAAILAIRQHLAQTLNRPLNKVSISKAVRYAATQFAHQLKDIE